MILMEVTLRPIGQMITGDPPLEGTATVVTNGNTLEFPLSNGSIQTIRECMERDYADVVAKLSKDG